MSDFGEAMGTAIEGVIVADAIEREAKRGYVFAPVDEHGNFAENACLNCATPLNGSHCHSCGQKAHAHRSLKAIGHDLVHGVLHLDGKLWRTLPLLVTKPGELTRRYIEGERVKFVSPMAMFLFSVFLMFAVFQLTGITTPTSVGSSDAAVVEIDNARDEVRDEIADLEARLDELPANDPERQAVQTELDGAQQAKSALESTRSVMGTTSGGFTPTGDTGWAFLDKINKKWRENPGLMLYKLQANSYKFSWLLIPLSIPFVWLVFAWKRRFQAYDHAVFVTYSLAFMSLLFIVLSVLGALGMPSEIIALTAIFAPPIHIYKQLRRAYGLRRLSALWRLAYLLCFAIVLVVSAFVTILTLLGAF